MGQEVTFETKCWEKDYKLMLCTDHLSRMIENCNYQFAHKQLIVNNVNDEDKVALLVSDLKEKGVIDSVWYSSKMSDIVLDKYEIDKNSFEGGYYYSIAELVGIYNCKTKYLLHFSSDSYIPKRFSNSNWIKEAIEIMENNPEIIVANPTWNYKYDEARNESDKVLNDGKFYLAKGFSDQCYLINTEVFKNPIYNFKHPYLERYPKYGGNLFEKRVDSYMRTNDKNRIICCDISYVSKNIKWYNYFLEKYGIKKI